MGIVVLGKTDARLRRLFVEAAKRRSIAAPTFYEQLCTCGIDASTPQIVTIVTERGANAEGVLAQINIARKELPLAKIMIFDQNKFCREMVEYIRFGAHAYLTSREEELIGECFAELYNGVNYFTPQFLHAVLSVARTKNTRQWMRLKGTEREIAMYLCEGMSPVEIAAFKNLRQSTVSMIPKRVYRKLQVSNVLQLSQAIHSGCCA